MTASGVLPTVAEKACTKCKLVKSAADFYRNPKSKSGLYSSCRACGAVQTLRWKYASPENLKRSRERSRAWNDAHPDKIREAHRRSFAKHPEKQAARRVLNRAIEAGTITRMPCEKCGTPKAQGHHEDYSKPLDVRWMCQPCHGLEHRIVVAQ